MTLSLPQDLLKISFSCLKFNPTPRISGGKSVRTSIFHRCLQCLPVCKATWLMLHYGYYSILTCSYVLKFIIYPNEFGSTDRYFIRSSRNLRYWFLIRQNAKNNVSQIKIPLLKIMVNF